jgi:hypothetical protein
MFPFSQMLQFPPILLALILEVTLEARIQEVVIREAVIQEVLIRGVVIWEVGILEAMAATGETLVTLVTSVAVEA